MNLKEEIILLLEKYNLRPIKYRGQNFLINKKFLEKITSLGELKTGETVIEVGPGIGNLTKKLLEKRTRVIAVEKDKDLARVLAEEIPSKNLKIVINDILKFDENIIKSPYKVMGNIPYYITGPIIKKFLFKSNQPDLIILTIQKEVAERLAIKPPKATFISITLSMLADIYLADIIKAENFWPEPRVDSQIIKIKPKRKITHKDKELIKFISHGFKQPRKTLLNNLLSSNIEGKQKIQQSIIDVGLSEKTRAHELTLKKWEDLWQKLYTSNGSNPEGLNRNHQINT